MAIYHLSHTYVGKTNQKAAYTAAAHCAYITRPGAATEVLGARMPTYWRSACAWLNAQEDGDRKNARVIDKLEVALPKELSHDQRTELVRVFAERLSEGRTSWLAAIHDGARDSHNPHAHIILRDRDVETGRRVAMTSERHTVDRIRLVWEQEANFALERAGRPERVDRRTLEEQGIQREAQIHVGPGVQVMEAKGLPLESQAREVQRIDFTTGKQVAVTVDYPAIDQGRTRAQHNTDIKVRNAAREVAGLVAAREPDEAEKQRQRPATAWASAASGPGWTSRGGMVAQQASAALWARAVQSQAAEPARSPNPWARGNSPPPVSRGTDDERGREPDGLDR